ncbi:MAG TPA: GerMN domain-containing protein, partial [Spirochaetota bacterium]|nr:GerMN domain-containing protein [Spirochaetota bacterium]
MAKKKTNGRSGFLFLFLIILLLGVIVYFNRQKFLVLSSTLFKQGKEYIYDKINKKDVNIVEKIDKIEKNNVDIKDNKSDININNKNENKKSKINERHIEKKAVKENPKKIEKNFENKEKVKEDNSYTVKTIIKENSKEKNITVNNKDKENNGYQKKTTNTKIARIYFTKIDEKENLKLTSVPKKITYTDSPLTETMKTLLNGPDKSEESLDIVTNIPKNSKILSIKISNNIAYINFSKDFEYNQYGRESTINQLKQIVYTATEFPNI